MAGFSSFAIGDSIFKHLGDSYSVFTIGLFNGIFALMVICGVCAREGVLKTVLRTKFVKLHIFRGFLITGQILCTVYAFKFLPLASTYALVFVAPFVTALLAVPILKEHISAKKMAAVVAGFTGVLIILRPGMIPIEAASFIAIAGACMFALSSVLVRYIGRRTENEHAMTYVMYVELVIVLACFVLSLTDFVWPAPFDIFLLAIAGVLGAAGVIFVTKGFIHAKAGIAASFHYVQILWGIFLGYLFFDDVLDLYTGLGAAIVVGSGLFLIICEQKEKDAEEDIKISQTAIK